MHQIRQTEANQTKWVGKLLIGTMIIIGMIWLISNRYSSPAFINFENSGAIELESTVSIEPSVQSENLLKRNLPSKGELIFDSTITLPSAQIETITHHGLETRVASLISSTQEKGVVLLFHGCSWSAESWFILPEERTIVKALYSNGYSVIAFSSLDRMSKCWDASTFPAAEPSSKRANQDMVSVLGALEIWLKRENRTHLPLFALGASSGGSFVSLLVRAMYLLGAVIMISPGSRVALTAPPAYEHEAYHHQFAHLDPPILDSNNLGSKSTLFNVPPLIFIFMAKDTNWASGEACQEHKKLITLQNPRLSNQIQIWRIDEHPWTEETLLKIDAIRSDKHGGLCSALFYFLGHQSTSNLHESNPFARLFDEPTSSYQPTTFTDTIFDLTTHLLKRDPRSVEPWPILRGMLIAARDQEVTSASTEETTALTHPFHNLNPTERQSIYTTCLQLFDTHSASLIELFNVHYGQHEMTSERIVDQVKWQDQLVQEYQARKTAP